MSTHYYASGATHNDHHKELNINGSITPEQLRQLARRFLDDEAEEADVMADALALSPRWAPFERLWGIKDLVHKHSQAKLCGYYEKLRGDMKFELN